MKDLQETFLIFFGMCLGFFGWAISGAVDVRDPLTTFLWVLGMFVCVILGALLGVMISFALNLLDK